MIQTIIDNKENIAVVVSSVISIFAVVATLTENTSDNKVLAIIYKVINVLGLNIGKSKNI